MLRLNEVIELMNDGDVAKALFADSVWYITKEFGAIRYYYPFENEDDEVGALVALSYSNLTAYYEIVK